jgi:5'-3' exonuclease
MSRGPGIGPKTASQLIQQLATLEAVLANADQITKPKLKQNLIEHADAARLSRRLVELVCDAPLPEPLDELELKGIPQEPLGLPRRAGVQVASQPALGGGGRRAEQQRPVRRRRRGRAGRPPPEPESDHRRPHEI